MPTDPAKRAFWLSCGATMSLAISSNLPPVFLTTFGETFGGLTEEQLGRLAGTVFVGFVVGIASASPFADRFGAKPFILLGMCSLVAGLASMAMAHAYYTLQLAVFIAGFGAGVLEVVLSPVVAALQPHRRAAALNWMHASYCFGAVGTVLLGSFALRHGIPWRATTLGIIFVPACVLAGFSTVKTLPLVHDEGDCEPLRQLIHHRFIWAAVALIALGGGTEIGMAQWLPAYAERSLGFTKSDAGIALAGYSVAMLIGRIAVGHILHHMRATTLMILSCIAAVGLILAGSFAPERYLALTACVLSGFAVCCFWPTTLGLASDRYPRAGASMFGLLAGFGNTGCTIVPWVVGLIADRTQLNVGISAIIACPLTMMAILVWITLAKRRAISSSAT